MLWISVGLIMNTAIATNVVCFSLQRAFFFVFVSVPPSVTTRPSNKTVIENTMVAFACSASGNPVPKITWVKDGESIRMGGKLSFKAARNDSGLYSCLADNGLQPAANSSALLDVQCECYTPIKKYSRDYRISVTFK